MMQLSLTGPYARRACFSSLAVLAAAFVLVVLPAFPQNVTGGLTGIVRDPSGSVVPNASLTATHTGTSASFRAKTNEEGQYAFPTLPVGTYQLAVEAPGFKKYETSGIRLQVSEIARVDVSLVVGVASETVSVTDGTP